MNFSFTYAPGTSLAQMIGFETAGRLWASHLTDPVTVNIYVEPTNTLPVGVAGGALMGIRADQSYSTWRTSLAADRTSATDQTVHQNLPSNTASFTAWVNEINATGMTSNKLEQSSDTLNLSRANAKALGMLNGQETTLDGYILINNQLPSLGLNWNYDLSGTIPANGVDFFSVAVHEIGHVLGFYSGVDASGWQITPIEGFFDDDDDDDDDNSSGGGERDPRTPLRNATSLDMLRFSNQDKLDLVMGGSPFFSVDGGTTKRADFSTGVDRNLGGDGYQASHWKASGGTLGIMEPTFAPGQRRDLLALDREALDAIGWDAGSGTANLIDLQNQAKSALATRLGVTVAQLEANPALSRQLTQDRSQDAITMIEQSQIYEWGWSRRSRSTGYVRGEITIPAIANGTLATGWGNTEAAGAEGTGIDSLTAAGSQSNLSTSTQPQPNLETFSATPVTVGGSMFTNPTPTLAPVNALSPDYLIGSDWSQMGF